MGFRLKHTAADAVAQAKAFRRPLTARLGLLALVLTLCAGSYALSPQALTQETPPPAETGLRPYVPDAQPEPATPPTPAPAPAPATATPAPRPAQTATNARPGPPRPTTAATLATAQSPTPVVGSSPAPVLVTRPVSGEDIATFTDAYVRGLMQRDHVLGVTVAVVQGNTPLLIKGYGYDRLNPARPVNADTSLFRIGSITKALTWIVARQEIESGRIKPDSPLKDFLPADLYTPDPRFGDLTLNDVMSHSTGYEDTALGHLFRTDPNLLIAPDTYFRIHRPERVRKPGAFSSYSNYAPALAATALAGTTRSKDVPTLMEIRIFEPLGLSHTTLREPYSADIARAKNLPDPMSAELAQGLSQGFAWDGTGYAAQPFDHTIALSGALSATSTARDMGRLMSAMLGGGSLDGVQLYDATSAQAFRTPLRPMPEGYNGWASGLVMRTLPSGLVTYGHGGSTLWFHSSMMLVPEMNIGIFISTNTQTGAALTETYPMHLIEHLENTEARAPLMPTAAMARDAHKAQYQNLDGLYVSSRRAYGGLEGAVSRLLNTVEVTFEENGRLILSTQTGTSAYLPTSAPAFFMLQDINDSGPGRDLGGLHFLTDGGRLTGFETASNMARYEKVGWLHKPGTLGTLTLLQIITCAGVWLFLLKPTDARQRATEAQVRATLLSLATALLWVGAIGLFYLWKEGVLNNPDALFTQWPSGQVRLASTLALLATSGTLVGLVNTYFVFVSDSHFHSGWPAWQKALHGILMLWWVFYAGVLALWGALQPWSW